MMMTEASAGNSHQCVTPEQKAARYARAAEFLRAPAGRTLMELAEHLNVSRRTMFRVVSEMRAPPNNYEIVQVRCGYWRCETRKKERRRPAVRKR